MVDEMYPLEQETAEDTQRGKFLTFVLDNEAYGIEIKYVTEIIRMQPITSVPEASAYVKGIINLRGKIIPVIDLRIKFRKEAAPYNERTCIIIVNINGVSLGLIVDSVSEVADIPDDSIVAPPDYKTGFNNRYIKGIAKSADKVKLLLDCGKLLTDDEIEELSGIDNE